VGTGDRDAALLERLAQRLQHGARELGELVEGQARNSELFRVANERGLTNNAGTVARVLDELVDRGELERTGRTEGSGAMRYQRRRQQS
jgi:hypothetical protein